MYKALLKCVATEESAWTAPFPGDDPGGTAYIWNDGNYACDCNRKGFFEAALYGKDNVPHPIENTCGHGAFELIEIRHVDGRTLVMPMCSPPFWTESAK